MLSILSLLFSAICVYLGVCLAFGHMFIPSWNQVWIVLRTLGSISLVCIGIFLLLYALEHG